MYCIYGNVELLRSSEKLQIWHLKHSMLSACNRMLDTIFKAVELHLLWHFLIFYNTLPRVSFEIPSVQLQLEIVSSASSNLNWFSVVQFFHSFNFSKHDIVTILV